jgi:hypothetical protein
LHTDSFLTEDDKLKTENGFWPAGRQRELSGNLVGIMPLLEIIPSKFNNLYEIKNFFEIFSLSWFFSRLLAAES